MIGKLIEGILRVPSENEMKKIIITNPTEEILKNVMGYKDIIEGEKPEYDEQTQYIETKYIDGDVITTVYEVVDIPIQTEKIEAED